MPERGLGIRFKVKIDGHDDLGDWFKCEGLTVEYDIQEYPEGGQNAFVHRIPGRCKFPNIKLSRPLDQHSHKLAAWVSGQQKQVKRHTATITVLDAAGDMVTHYDLDGAFPVRWTGPQLDVGGNQGATEVLELSHNGFLPGEGWQ